MQVNRINDLQFWICDTGLTFEIGLLFQQGVYWLMNSAIPYYICPA